jgi:biotin/methionine sulfoxide reductase
MAVTLAAMLGQIGLPGGGFGCGYSATNGIGQPTRQINWAALPQGHNPVADFIPVARISDLLLRPGETIDYDGRRLTLPDIRLIYWVGGNPFHHHQDINRLLRAWQQPETIIVHERWWNTLARHADIVLPATTALERNDVAFNKRDGFAIAMQQAVPPVGQARNDHDIFAALAERFGVHKAFTEERSELDWLRYIYNVSRQRAAEDDVELPDFETFWQQGYLELPAPPQPRVLLSGFRDNPENHPLRTPSGRIEIFSETIAGFAYDDCPGHPVWLEPLEWLGSEKTAQYPLHLISNQPKTRLHSQLDNGSVSRASKIQGREPMLINPQDAAARAIEDGSVVRVFNDRGACFAGVTISAAIQPGVVALATGAWYDPLEPGVIGTLDKHGNANVLTPDKGTSKLAQAPIAHSTLVEVERFDGELPSVTVFTAPPIVQQ